MSYTEITEMKNAFKEATKNETNQGDKEFFKAIGGGLLIGIGAYLYGSHAVELGRRVGRAQVFDDLSEAAEKLESSIEDNKN